MANTKARNFSTHLETFITSIAGHVAIEAAR